MKKLIIAVVGIVFLAAAFGGSGCSGGTGTPGDLDSIIDPSGATQIDDGWFVNDGDDAFDLGDDYDDPAPPAEDPTPPADDPTPRVGGGEACELPHSFDVMDKEFRKGDVVEIVLNAFGGSGEFNWSVPWLPDWLDWEKSENSKHLTIFGTAVEVTDGPINVSVRLYDINCPANDGPPKKFKIDVGINPGDFEVRMPTSEEPVGTIQDCSAPVVYLKVEGDALDDGTTTLSEDETVQIDAWGDVDLTPTINEEGDNVGRYKIWSYHVYDDGSDFSLDRFDYKDEGEATDEIRTNTFTPMASRSCTSEDDAQFCSTIVFSVKDTACNMTRRYTVQVNKVCRIARLDDIHFRVRVKYEHTKDYGFDRKTKVRFPLLNDTHNERTNYITTAPTVKLSEKDWNNRIDDIAKDFTFGPAVLDDDDNAHGKGMCLESITGFGFMFKDGVDGPSDPSLHVERFEVKACRNHTYLINGSDNDCYIANWSGRIGFSEIDDKNRHFKSASFIPDPEDDLIWNEGTFELFDLDD